MRVVHTCVPQIFKISKAVWPQHRSDGPALPVPKITLVYFVIFSNMYTGAIALEFSAHIGT